jgi:pimeloyl-ACP methyl ester carboxylesterase
MPFYQKGDIRIRYEEVGSGFPLLVTPGGGLNSRVGNWPTAVINAMEEFKNDFRCITMDQRNANGIRFLLFVARPRRSGPFLRPEV